MQAPSKNFYLISATLFRIHPIVSCTFWFFEQISEFEKSDWLRYFCFDFLFEFWLVIDETVRLHHTRSQFSIESRIKEISWSQLNESQFSLIWFLSKGVNLRQTQFVFIIVSFNFQSAQQHSISITYLINKNFWKKILAMISK